MKKSIVAAILLAGLSTFAQDLGKNPRREKSEQMTLEQKNELRLKKLTLDLGLNAIQQKEMSKIIAEMETKREAFKTDRLAKKEAGKTPTKDERFAVRTKHLDDQIANKARVKKILDPKQFEKWEKMQEEKMEKIRKNGRAQQDIRAIEK